MGAARPPVKSLPFWMLAFTLNYFGCGHPMDIESGAPHVMLPAGQQNNADGSLQFPSLALASSGGTLALGAGAVLHAPLKVKAIFWGPEWTNAIFAKDKITGIDAFFYGFSGSNLAKIVTEYTDGSGAATSTLSYQSHTIDSKRPPSVQVFSKDAVAEICGLYANNPDSSTMYFLYGDSRLTASYLCGWHSYGTCPSTGVHFAYAYIGNVTSLEGCQMADGSTGHSADLASMANISSHELMEAITDPVPDNGWVDSLDHQSEIGDKCAWIFGPSLYTFTDPITQKKTKWKVQTYWSNYAYTHNISAGPGVPYGCVQYNPQLAKPSPL